MLRNNIITMGLLILSSFSVHRLDRFKDSDRDYDLSFNLPVNLNNWIKIENINFDDRIINILGTKNVFGGEYKNSDDKIDIIIVYAVNNRNAFHPPEYCLTGIGSEIIENNKLKVAYADGPNDNIKLNEILLLQKNGKKLLVWNWYIAGQLFTDSYYKQQLAIFYNIFKHGISKDAMITLYSEVKDNDIYSNRKILSDFLKALIPFLYENIINV